VLVDDHEDEEYQSFDPKHVVVHLVELFLIDLENPKEQAY